MHGKLRDGIYFPFGGEDLTIVMQYRWRIMLEAAEELRIKYGIVIKESQRLYGDSRIVVPRLRNNPEPENRSVQSDGGRLSVISKRDISNFLFPKVEEIMGEVYKKIEPFLKEGKKLPHISVVGGLSRMDGFVETVEEVFGVPVHMGRICNTKDFCDINFACSLGLARYGIRNRAKRKSSHLLRTDSFIGKTLTKIQKLFSGYF